MPKKYVKTYRSRTLWGKLRVNRMLSANTSTASMVPHTVSFSLKHLESMAKRYKTLYIKPNVGSLGIGIHRLRRAGADRYELASVRRRKQQTLYFKNIQQVFTHLQKKKELGPLLIQRGITLEHLDGKPYDIRVMVQRRPKGAWTCTSMMAKIAQPKRIVTNVHQGAKLHVIADLWSMKRLSKEVIQANNEKLESSALAVSNALSSRYSGMHEMGIDFAVDNAQKLWLLEVNTNHPQFGPMKKLDPAAYNRMVSFARSYGRRDD